MNTIASAPDSASSNLETRHKLPRSTYLALVLVLVGVSAIVIAAMGGEYGYIAQSASYALGGAALSLAWLILQHAEQAYGDAMRKQANLAIDIRVRERQEFWLTLTEHLHHAEDPELIPDVTWLASVIAMVQVPIHRPLIGGEWKPNLKLVVGYDSTLAVAKLRWDLEMVAYTLFQARGFVDEDRLVSAKELVSEISRTDESLEAFAQSWTELVMYCEAYLHGVPMTPSAALSLVSLGETFLDRVSGSHADFGRVAASPVRLQLPLRIKQNVVDQ